MQQEQLFSMALGLSTPWFVERVDFQSSATNTVSELHIHLAYKRPHKFMAHSEHQGVYDHIEKSWKHLNFFQHQCYLHADVPRVKNVDGKVSMIDVPWARPGSGFTLLFEAFSLVLMQSGLSMTAAGKLVGEDGKLLCRILRHYVGKAMQEQPLEQVEKLGMDETSIAKGHHYITVATDMERKKVVGIAEGKDSFAFAASLGEMLERGSQLEPIKAIAMDMSQAYTSAALEFLPQAQIVYDRFHLEAVLSKALDGVRKIENQHTTELRKTKYIWLRNKSSLRKEQSEQIHYLSQAYPALGEAYRLKEQFKEIWKNTTLADAKEAYEQWIKMAWDSEIIPIRRAVNTFKSHRTGILNYFEYKLTSGFAERVNLSIQEIKRTAKGFKNIENFKAMIYLKLGGLTFNTHSI